MSRAWRELNTFHSMLLFVSVVGVDIITLCYKLIVSWYKCPYPKSSHHNNKRLQPTQRKNNGINVIQTPMNWAIIFNLKLYFWRMLTFNNSHLKTIFMFTYIKKHTFDGVEYAISCTFIDFTFKYIALNKFSYVFRF